MLKSVSALRGSGYDKLLDTTAHARHRWPNISRTHTPTAKVYEIRTAK